MHFGLETPLKICKKHSKNIVSRLLVSILIETHYRDILFFVHEKIIIEYPQTNDSDEIIQGQWPRGW